MIPYKSLSHFIQVLEKNNELIRIKTYVDPLLEIAEITDRISKQPGGGKALLFENTGTGFPLLINSMGSEKRICLALGVKNLDDIGDKFSSFLNHFTGYKSNIWQKLKMLPALKEVSSWLPVTRQGRGLCQQVVLPSTDLNKLPVLKCWPKDGGRFITLPLVHTLDPDSGIRNVGMYRMQVFSNDTTGMHWHRHKTGARHFNIYKSQQRLMPVAVALGGDPVYTYSATAPLPDNVDEYLFAGFLRNKRVELVKCLTQDIQVPNDADIVLEGFVDPAEPLAWEGPFGDHTGFYSLAGWYPVFHITCITHRKDAVYPATIVGIPPQEDAWISKATERIFLAPMRIAMANEIIDINLPVEGIAHNLAIVKINKTYPGQAFKVMNALWGAGQMMFNKVMIVTGPETDIFSPLEVLKSVISNVKNPSHINIQLGPSDVLDHASRSFTYGGKLCLDATSKLPEECENGKYNEQTSQKNEIDKFDFDISSIRKLFENNNDIGSFNPFFLEIGLGLLILSIHKNRKFQAKEMTKLFMQSPLFENIHFIIFTDVNVPLDNISFITWLVLANIDPLRDSYINENEEKFCISIDGTKKILDTDDIHFEWPPIIISDNDTIRKVDEKWPLMSLGELINSPSLNINI